MGTGRAAMTEVRIPPLLLRPGEFISCSVSGFRVQIELTTSDQRCASASCMISDLDGPEYEVWEKADALRRDLDQQLEACAEIRKVKRG